MTNRMALVFANIDNSTMDLFTSARSIGALPFGGRYRLIDFTLSNLVNGGVYQVGVPVREKYQALLDHIGVAREWDLDRRTDGLTFLPPFVKDYDSAYDTKLKALRGSMMYLHKSAAYEYIFLCEPDVICNIDMDDLLDLHIESGADVTYLTVDRNAKNYHGTFALALAADETGRVTSIADDEGDPSYNHLGMGISVMKRSLLLDLLAVAEQSNSIRFFDTGLINRYTTSLDIRAIDYTGYVAKIRNLYDYFKASMDMFVPEIRKDVFFRSGHVYTKTHADVPVLYGLNSDIKESLIADGSSVEGSVKHSIIFRRVKIGRNTKLESCIIMQDSVIEEGAELRYCIADKNVRVTAGAKIIGTPEKPRLLTKGQTYSH
ncbi:MAG: glucose-1-phosphate adenylyltransferase subunit GlgD [Clostridia bacterium]|nr:glucose-1-phosphate adenylyltransferase subunit GlgD [Clostridia bacterium]